MIKRNLIANFLGQGWTALIGFAFIPLYIKFLGIESYGLIGVFAVLQAWLALLDVGMSPTLGREMARFTAGAISVQQLRDLLRSIEFLTCAIGLTIIVIVTVGSHWIATTWLKPQELSPQSISQALSVMGIAVATRMVENIYRSSLMGLQHQVLLNILGAIFATVRTVGAVVVLALISPTVEAFFVWQALASFASAICFAVVAYKLIPIASRSGRFSLEALRRVMGFAGGIIGITFLSLLLMQSDKILLSKLLSLSEYGYYSLAAVAAGSIYAAIAPIALTFYPRLCELNASGDRAGVSEAYHFASQLVSVIVGSLAIVLITFAESFLQLWTQNSQIAQSAAPLLRLLALGNLLNCLMWMPYQLQLASGWPGLALRINAVAVAIMVPAIMWVTPHYGPVGAAWIWVLLNAGYLVIGVNLMFRRLLVEQKWAWYISDVGVPLGIGALGASLLGAMWPLQNDDNMSNFILLAVAVITTGLLTLASAKQIRLRLCLFVSVNS